MLNFRNALQDDLGRIVEIYNSTIQGRMVTADTEPVTVESRQAWFEAHHPQHRPLWVVEVGGEMVGWASFQSFYGRPAYEITAEISIYLDPSCRGKGFGKEILRYCMAQATGLGLNNLLGFIFSHNTPSLRMFESQGFEKWGVLPAVAVLDGVKRNLEIWGKHLV